MSVAQLVTPQDYSPVSSDETVGRHPLNFYESPSWFPTELLRHVELSGVIAEPCVGSSAILLGAKN